MKHCNGVKQGLRAAFNLPLQASKPSLHRRALHYDGRNRLSNFWTPTQAAAATSKRGSQSTTTTVANNPDDGHDRLLRAGFLRQAHSGIFHLLPLGLRVQDKIERLVDKHMLRLGASKVSLSSFTSEDLWQRSGRLDPQKEKGRGSEFFRLEDRKGAKYLLSPTHEEEITTIVVNAVHSYKDLPLRLYQVSRKYRDEARPRQGLLRGREFLMKDLYTFDATEEQARQTYDEVRRAYVAFLDELGLPYLVANADSGNMGGSLSHEYHFASEKGEDVIISCKECGYSVNEELYAEEYDSELHPPVAEGSQFQDWNGISKDRQTRFSIHYPLGGTLNVHAVKRLYPDIDVSVEDTAKTSSSSASSTALVIIRDPRLPSITSHHTISPYLLTAATPSTPCPSCHKSNPHPSSFSSPPSTLTLTRAVEIGHTFHLSTRYTQPLNATILTAQNTTTPISMGCHGLGLSRLIAATSSILSDERGLGWPLAIAPFAAVIVPSPSVSMEDVARFYDRVVRGDGEGGREGRRGGEDAMDVVIDDRPQHPMGWKLKDADAIGYPFVLVLGKVWGEGKAEVQCRRLGVREEVRVEEVRGRMEELGARL